jgi:hypothetical protein
MKPNFLDRELLSLRCLHLRAQRLVIEGVLLVVGVDLDLGDQVDLLTADDHAPAALALLVPADDRDHGVESAPKFIVSHS